MAEYSKAHQRVDLSHFKKAMQEIQELKIDWLREKVDSSDRWHIYLDHGGQRYPLKPLVARATQIAIDDDNYKSTWAHSDAAKGVARRLGFGDDIVNVSTAESVDQAVKYERELISRLARQGHARFREETLLIWSDCCAVTGVKDRWALEAAHIKPHAEGGEMKPANGIALRADIHRLFDMDLIAINPKTLEVAVNENLTSSYTNYAGRQITLPQGGPKSSDFSHRWQEFENTWEAP